LAARRRRYWSGMDTARLLVTLLGFAAIGWVLWHFLVPPEKRAPKDGERR